MSYAVAMFGHAVQDVMPKKVSWRGSSLKAHWVGIRASVLAKPWIRLIGHAADISVNLCHSRAGCLGVQQCLCMM